jgi:hypothetical protein
MGTRRTSPGSRPGSPGAGSATGFGIYLGLPSEKYKIVSWKKKDFEDLKDLLFSFRLNFVIIKDSS